MFDMLDISNIFSSSEVSVSQLVILIKVIMFIHIKTEEGPIDTSLYLDIYLVSLLVLLKHDHAYWFIEIKYRFFFSFPFPSSCDNHS